MSCSGIWVGHGFAAFVAVALFAIAMSGGGFVGLQLPGPHALALVLDVDRHLHIGKLLLEGDDVGVAQADAALAGAARNALLIVGAAWIPIPEWPGVTRRRNQWP